MAWEEGGYPPYAETYPLPFVFIADGIVWGATRYTHTIVIDGEGPKQVCAFHYCDRGDLYVITYYSPLAHAGQGQTLAAQIRPGAQYDEYRMIARPAGEQVWTSGDPDTSALAASVAAGNPHYVVLRWDEMTATSLPLDLVYDFTETGTFELRTEFIMLAGHVVTPAAFLAQLRASLPDHDAAVRRKDLSIETHIPTHVPMYRVLSDGTATAFGDLKSRSTQRPLDITVFSQP